MARNSADIKTGPAFLESVSRRQEEETAKKTEDGRPVTGPTALIWGPRRERGQQACTTFYTRWHAGMGGSSLADARIPRRVHLPTSGGSSDAQWPGPSRAKNTDSSPAAESKQLFGDQGDLLREHLFTKLRFCDRLPS